MSESTTDARAGRTSPAYCSVEELARALRTRVTDANRDDLQRCCDAASNEVDAWLDRFADDPLPLPPDTPAEVVSVTIVRAVEWAKAGDAAFGVLGFTDTGALRVPRDPFSRHSLAIVHLKEQFGLA